MIVGVCWTDDEIASEAENPSAVALVTDRGSAQNLAREMNTMLSARAVLKAPVRLPTTAKKAFCGRCGDAFYVSAGFRNLCRPCRSACVKEGIANRPRVLMPLEGEPHVH